MFLESPLLAIECAALANSVSTDAIATRGGSQQICGGLTRFYRFLRNCPGDWPNVSLNTLLNAA
jgi:hypothetical protein